MILVKLMKEIIKLAIVGVVMALFILFLAFFAIHEDDLVGKGQDQNISGATGNIEIPFIKFTFHHPDTVDIGDIILIKENVPILND